MFLTPNPQLFFSTPDWFYYLPWHELELEVTDYYDRTYGVVKSRHICFDRRQRIEFSFGYTNWANIKPIDPGTCKVVSSGLRIIYDPHLLLTILVTTIGRV